MRCDSTKDLYDEKKPANGSQYNQENDKDVIEYRRFHSKRLAFRLLEKKSKKDLQLQ